MKRTIIFLTALTTFCASLTACSSKTVTKPDSPGVTVEDMSVDAVSSECFRHEEIPLPEGINSAQSIEFLAGSGDVILECTRGDGFSTVYFRSDASFSDFTELTPELPAEYETADAASCSLFFNPDGSYNCLLNLEDHGGIRAPEKYDESFDYESYYSDVTMTAMICVCDRDGRLQSSGVIAYPEELISEVGYITVNSSISNGDSLIQTAENGSVYNITPDGKVTKVYSGSRTADAASYSDMLIRSSDGSIIFGKGSESQTFDSNGYESWVQSMDFCKVMTIFEPGERIYSIDDLANEMRAHPTAGWGEYLMLMPTEKGLVGVKGDGSSKRLISWADSDLTPMQVICTGENEYVGLNTDNYSHPRLLRLTPRDPAELENVQVITLATPYGVFPAEAINDFNGSQDKYRIKTVTYTPDDPMYCYSSTQLNLDIAAGKAPDIIMGLEYGTYMSFREKGLFTDLYPLMEGDDRLDRTMMMEPFLKAMESPDGSLRGIAPNYRLNTLVIKSKFHDKPDWTFDEFMALYDAPPATADRIYAGFTKDEQLTFFRYLIDDFIDYENAVCHFDDPDFARILEFCNRFSLDPDNPDKDYDPEWSSYIQDRQNWFRDDRVLTQVYTINHFVSYCNLKYLEGGGEDITLVGLPASNRKGARIEPNSICAVSESCKCKEGAWEFLKSYLIDENTISPDDYSEAGIPLLKDTFTTLLDREMVTQRYAQGREIPMLSQAERDQIYDYVMAADCIGCGADHDLDSIIREEAGLYFAGEQTVQKAVDHIQNRASILISEKS